MRFEVFNYSHVEDSVQLALSKYNKEKQLNYILPVYNQQTFKKEIIDSLVGMAENRLGAAAIENNKLIGFLACYNPIENYFGTSNGVFAPIHANGSINDNTAEIYTRLYTFAAHNWVKRNLLSHVVEIYSHDSRALSSFYYNGFGLRCVTAVRPLDIIAVNAPKGYSYTECYYDNDFAIVAHMENNIQKHLRKSPSFMPNSPDSDAKRVEESINSGEAVYYLAKYQNETVGFIKLGGRGENFISAHPLAQNICGAYLNEEHRSKNIFPALINYAIEKLQKTNCLFLCVDYESINPNANAFWTKYFSPYTYSLARRIDERIYPVKDM